MRDAQHFGVQSVGLSDLPSTAQAPPAPAPSPTTSRRAPTRQASKAGTTPNKKKNPDGGPPGPGDPPMPASTGKGPDYTGNDADNFRENNMLAPQSSSESFTTFRSRALMNDASTAAVLTEIRRTIRRLQDVADQRQRHLEQRVERAHDVLGDHAENVQAALDLVDSTSNAIARLDGCALPSQYPTSS